MMRPRFAWITGAACAGWLIAVTGTTLAAQGAYTSPFLKESALVFRASDLKNGKLPSRIHQRNMPAVFSSQVTLACLGVPLQPDDLFIYLVESKSCMALRDWNPASSALTHNPQAAGGLAQERVSLEQQLERSALVVMQPEVMVAQTAAVCYCPIKETVFSSGFEDG